MKRFSTIIVLIYAMILAGVFSVCAQDPGFTQFYANKLYLNPAFAGEGCPRLTLNYRNQWPALGSTYITYNVSGDMFIKKILGGIGLSVMRDMQGDGAITTTNIDAMYAYTVDIQHNITVKAGFEASYFQKRLNWDFVFPDMIHPMYGVIFANNETNLQDQMGEMNRDFFDFSAGVTGFNDIYYLGFAVHHLTQPVESFRGNASSVLPRKYTLHVGARIPITGLRFKKGDLFLSPNLLFQQQQDFQQFTYGMYANHKNFVLGLSLRQNLRFHYDSFIMMMGYAYQDFTFVYSYDLTVSKMRNQTMGAHEISCIINFACLKKQPKPHTSPCNIIGS